MALSKTLCSILGLKPMVCWISQLFSRGQKWQQDALKGIVKAQLTNPKENVSAFCDITHG